MILVFNVTLIDHLRWWMSNKRNNYCDYSYPDRQCRCNGDAEFLCISTQNYWLDMFSMTTWKANIHSNSSSNDATGVTISVAPWEVVPQGSMLRGAWKIRLCLLSHMKVSTITPVYHHHQRPHDPMTQIATQKFPRSQKSSWTMTGLNCSCT